MCFSGEGEVNSHLVAVEVGVIGGAGEGMKFDGAAFGKDGFEGLNAESVKSGSAVE